jgi:hypothetical protein
LGKALQRLVGDGQNVVLGHGGALLGRRFPVGDEGNRQHADDDQRDGDFDQ